MEQKQVECPRCGGHAFGDMAPGCMCGSCFDHCDLCNTEKTVTESVRSFYVGEVWDHYCKFNEFEYLSLSYKEDRDNKNCKCFEKDLHPEENKASRAFYSLHHTKQKIKIET